MSKPRLALASAQSDLEIHCQLTESLDTGVSGENKEFD